MKKIILPCLLIIYQASLGADSCKKIDDLLNQGAIEQAYSLAINYENDTELACLFRVAKAYYFAGRSEKSEKLLSGFILPKAENKLKANAFNLYALLTWNNGNYNEASAYMDEAFKILTEIKADDLSLAAFYNDYGLILSNHQPNESIQWYEKAYEIYLQNKNHQKAINTKTNIATAFLQQKNFLKSLQIYSKVLPEWQSLYPDGHPTMGFIWINLARIRQQMDERDKANKNFQSALELYLKYFGVRHPEVANVHILMGNFYNEAGDFTMAINHYQKAIIANTNAFEGNSNANPAIAKNTSDLIALNAIYYKSRAFMDRHYVETLNFDDLKVALSGLQTCDSIIDKVRRVRANESDKIAFGSIALEVYQTGVGLCYAMADVSFSKSKYEELAFYFSEKSKSAILFQSINDASAKQYAGLPDHLLEKEESIKSAINFYEQQLIAGNNREKINKIKSKIFDLSRQHDSLIFHMEKEYPNYYNLKYNTIPANLDELQAQLNDDEILLSYFIHNESGRIYIFEISADDYTIHRVYDENFQRYIRALGNGIVFREPQSLRIAGEKLYKMLIPRLNKKTRDLVIIPSGVLSTIPFEVLVSKSSKTNKYDEWEFLLHEANIKYQYSASLFVQARNSGDKNYSEKALLCAPVGFDDLPDLPATREEVVSLSGIFSKRKITSDMLLEQKASEDSFRKLPYKDYGYLHFATHGYVDEKDPELSRIFLAASQDEDGSLYSGEIYNLQLNAKLVTLSACETGLGKLSEGEGIIGLTRALLYAGADNVVVSFWTVADESTKVLMIRFYGNMTDDNYAKALREAKINIIAEKKFAEPYYWAPFILIGG